MNDVSPASPAPDLAAAVTALVAAATAASAGATPPQTPQTMLTVDEAAQILRCSRSLIYTQLRSGQLRGVKLGRRRLIPMREIERITGSAA